MSLPLINPLLDAYEAERADALSREARAEIDAYYKTAITDGDTPQVRRIEALAADIDAHDRYSRPSLLDRLRSNHQTAA